MRYWEPHWTSAVRVGCAHLQAKNDTLHDPLQQRQDHAVETPRQKCRIPSARSTASSQALCEGEGVATTSGARTYLF